MSCLRTLISQLLLWIADNYADVKSLYWQFVDVNVALMLTTIATNAFCQSLGQMHLWSFMGLCFCVFVCTVELNTEVHHVLYMQWNVRAHNYFLLLLNCKEPNTIIHTQEVLPVIWKGYATNILLSFLPDDHICIRNTICIYICICIFPCTAIVCNTGRRPSHPIFIMSFDLRRFRSDQDTAHCATSSAPRYI